MYRPRTAGGVVSQDTSHEENAERHGRFARRPWQIPWTGWKDVLWRVVDEVDNDRVFDLAAGVAFYGLLALFPALLGTVSIYSTLADPDDIVRQVNALSFAIPWTARSIIVGQLQEIGHSSTADLRIGLIASLAVALFSASGGVAALMRGINEAYDETETRGWIRFRLLALFFTLGLASFVTISVAVITLLPTVLENVGLETTARQVIQLGRWPALAAATMAGLGVLYRYAPNRTPAKWQWVSPGSVLATLVWTLASVSFSVYAENFGRFNRTYGTLGGAVVLGLWMFLSALAILVGAELNAELEHQTREDSTVGPPLPMGERGARMADTLGDLRPSTDESSSMREVIKGKLSDLNRGRRRKEVPNSE